MFNHAPLTAESPEVQRFLKAWHESGRAGWLRQFPQDDYDRDCAKTAETGRESVVLRARGRAYWKVRRTTGAVYRVNGGPVRDELVGNVRSMAASYERVLAERGAALSPLVAEGEVVTEAKLERDRLAMLAGFLAGAAIERFRGGRSERVTTQEDRAAEIERVSLTATPDGDYEITLRRVR